MVKLALLGCIIAHFDEVAGFVDAVAEFFRGVFEGDAQAVVQGAVFPAEILVKLYSTLGDIKKILTLISLSTQLLVLIAVTHIISITLSQQQHQLAALRAFGAPRGRIFLILWSGHIILMTLALSLGILGGWTLANIASHKLTASQGFRLPVHFTSQDALFITAILITAILALLIPTHSQFRRNPADILRRHD